MIFLDFMLATLGIIAGLSIAIILDSLISDVIRIRLKKLTGKEKEKNEIKSRE